MIIPMKKFGFLVYHKEYLDFLKGIQDLGVLHVIEKESGELEDEDVRLKYQELNGLNEAVKFLSAREIEASESTSKKEASDIVQELKELQHNLEENNQALAKLRKEQLLLEPWGDFSFETIEKLNEAGFSIDFRICPTRNFDPTWEETYNLAEISEHGGSNYFVLIHKTDEEVEVDAEKAILPESSLSKINAQISEVESVLENTEKLFDQLAEKDLAVLTERKEKLMAELDFDNVVLNTRKEAEDKLMFLEGWVPDEAEEAVVEFLDKSGVYYESSKPEPDEAPPIKLKNNGFSRLYESIGELYTLPKYGELDLTPFFAPFYMLFFGFCLGDAGYGLLITLGTIFGMSKASPKFKPLLKLGMYLGIATTIMGIVGGTFFGIMLHPDDFGDSSGLAPWIQNYQKFIVSSDNLMYIALGIGYLQVVFGMFLNAANRARMQGFKYALSQLGWNIIALVALPAFALGRLEVIPVETANIIALIALVIGAIPAFFYNTPGKNPFLNFGVGLWDTYQFLSGLLGDVLSYIRLFALGLSSAILGNVFNSLAFQAGGGFDSIGGKIIGAIFIVLILAFGHGLNFFMAALGSFVHPLRLTFVEFYKNAGFAGGGKKYSPFKTN